MGANIHLNLHLVVCFFLGLGVIDGYGTERVREVKARIGARLSAELQKSGLALGDQVYLRVYKKEEVMEVWMKPRGGKKYEPYKRYRIAGMSGGLGPKEAEGDYQAPEGCYEVTKGRLNPWSNYHLSFNVGYPNRYDRFHKRTGSYIMVHGSNVSAGCFAMTDPVIEEIYLIVEAALSQGQKVVHLHSFPYNFALEGNHRVPQQRRYRQWGSFWQDLRAVWEAFEETQTVPIIEVRDGKYAVKR